jgi:uncharacterized protein YndB with AHSA1/START domain
MTSTTAPDRSLVVDRQLSHAPEKVWRALTQGYLIEDWLMQNDFLPVVGHQFKLRANPNPHWNGVTDCEVLAVVPEKLLSYTWNSSGDEAGRLATVVTFTLTPTNGGHTSADGAVRLQARQRTELSGCPIWLAEVPCRTGPSGGRTVARSRDNSRELLVAAPETT